MDHATIVERISHLLIHYELGNSSGTFISASEDKTGVLDFIEQKIARATMLPKSHGEVPFLITNTML